MCRETTSWKPATTKRAGYPTRTLRPGGCAIEVDMMTRMLSRRRFIRISAASAGLLAVPFGQARADASLITWRGTMLGADATIKIHHQDTHVAERLVETACAEARRLERQFSLYL